MSRISFCITCMNCLADLQQTLPHNLGLARSVEKYEFVILDYNSKDALGEWVRENCADAISTGLLAYFRTDRPDSLKISHAKNVAHLLASSPVVCNLSADNFLTPAFLKFIESSFAENPESIAVSFNSQDSDSRIALYKDDFLKIGGYDEEHIFNKDGEISDLLIRLNHLEIQRISTHNLSILGKDISQTQIQPRQHKIHKRELSERNHETKLNHHTKGKFIANTQTIWGHEYVTKNFEETLSEVSASPAKSFHVSNKMWAYKRAGPLTLLERIAIASIQAQGYELNILSNGSVPNIPAGVNFIAGNKYLDPALTRGQLSSDFYDSNLRAEVMAAEGGWWTNLEIVLLERLDPLVSDEGYLFFSGVDMPFLDSIFHLHAKSLVAHRLQLIYNQVLSGELPEIQTQHYLPRIIDSSNLTNALVDPNLICPFNFSNWRALFENNEVPKTLAINLWSSICRCRGINLNGPFKSNSVIGQLIERFKLS